MSKNKNQHGLQIKEVWAIKVEKKLYKNHKNKGKAVEIAREFTRRKKTEQDV